MANSVNSESMENKNNGVLVIGDADAAVTGDRLISERYQHCVGLLDGVSLAATVNFTSIFVVMSGFSTRQLRDGLAAMRKNNTAANIVLLAQMIEEPLAKELQLMGNVINDYLICPVQTSAIIAERSALTDQSRAQAHVSISEIKELNAKIRRLEKLVTTDDLTGLKNRRYINEFLRQIIKHAKKEEMRITLLVFDIDDFKHYNDEYGHKVGDKVLQQAGALMLRCCRSHDVVGRIGGDEFAVIFWDRPSPEISADSDDKGQSERRGMTIEHPREPLFMAERFRTAISSAKFHFLGPKGKGSLTISGGLASFPHDGLTAEELFEQADKAMLEAKKSGKNRIDLVGGD